MAGLSGRAGLSRCRGKLRAAAAQLRRFPPTPPLHQAHPGGSLPLAPLLRTIQRQKRKRRGWRGGGGGGAVLVAPALLMARLAPQAPSGTPSRAARRLSVSSMRATRVTRRCHSRKSMPWAVLLP